MYLAIAKADLVRITSEIREALEIREGDETGNHYLLGKPSPENTNSPAVLASNTVANKIRGAIYISCACRGGPHFGSPNGELQIIQEQLGNIPLTGFFAGGEIACQYFYGYTEILKVFTI